MNRNELRHHGIKGQRWGIRRFQNKDGTLTSAGKKRYAESISDEEKSRIVKAANINKAYKKALTDGSKLKPVKELMESTKPLVNEAKKISDGIIKDSVKKTKLDLSKMTDKEMRDRINRQLLENQYNSLFAPEVSTVTKGQRTVNNILNYGGAVLTAGSTALGIALTIKQLKGGD